MGAFIARCGSMEGLLAEARARADDALLSLGRLDEDQLATRIHCELLHDGRVVVDEPRPWGWIAGEGQRDVHLPAHIGQLRDLRAPAGG